MTKVLRPVLCCLLLGMAGLCSAQERLRPAMHQELWTSMSVQGRAPGPLCRLLGNTACDRLRLGSELGYRSADVFFAGRQIYLDLTAHYKISKLVTVGLEQRFADRIDKANQQRTLVQVYLKRSFDRFNAGYRFYYQHNYVEWGGQREVFRNRFDLGYNIKKWPLDPEFGVEFFSWLGNKGLSYFGTRYHFGTEWSPADGHTIGISMIHDRERDVAYPTYRWIWSFSYDINLRKL